ncbi:MAG: hypothetical protein ACI8ZX_001442 [Planctomycetota bacterium]|jgi:hypothetical protein
MLKSETKINFSDKLAIENELQKTLKVFHNEINVITQANFFHSTMVQFSEKSAKIKVSFSKSFYFFYIIAAIVTVILPFENAFIGSSALALFLIFSSVIYFSLDYKLNFFLDVFN